MWYAAILFYIGMLLAGMIGAFVQTVVGFGAAVCILLFLTNFWSITSAPSVAAVVCLVLNFTLVIQFRRAIKIRPILCPMIIYSAVSLLVVAFIRSFKVTALTILFGIFLICLSIYYLFFSGRVKIREKNTGMMIASSSVSGLFAGLFSIGGPTLSLYYLTICGSGDFFIVSLQLSFLAANVVLCIGRIANGLLTADMLPAIVVGIVGALIGQVIGKRIRGKLSTALLSKLVYAAVGLSGLLVIIQQL